MWSRTCYGALKLVPAKALLQRIVHEAQELDPSAPRVVAAPNQAGTPSRAANNEAAQKHNVEV
jgi:hypothetical protein